ncbi:hypothetical protein F4553_003023 [Allocatelliglobosispora scoriae]|uniref:F5/8 type C domain-containing protein n=1 Tax=Allocatelliglobosispora scoriae TaxID=643052 RepID=A0A841BN02_9ACTN|nr:discoidin domain-containing protein [Allocatelliglobosispora scoriae]MBB5869644.1 hypothetical protein [Allocatelliglobosispora scoriae]
MRKRHVPRLLATLLATGLAISLVPTVPALAAGGPNLAVGKPTAESGHNDVYGSGNVNDGNQGTYWEGPNNTFPAWVQVDLGSSTSIDQVVLKIPSGWGARNETLSVQGSADGTSFGSIVGSATYSFNGSTNAVTINFTAYSTRFVRLNVTANTGWPSAQISELEVYGAVGGSTNLALGKTLTASSVSQTYVASNANDSNQGTYWESANNAFPQWLQVDLGAAVAVNKVVLKIPSGWGSRTETLTVQGSTNGSTFTTIVASAGYTFNPSANTVTINFTAATTRYVRLNITANTAWPAGQISEFEVYAPTGGGDTTPPTAPGSLAYTQPASGQIKLTWNASSDAVGVTGYDVYANGSLRTSVSGTTLTYTDSQPDTATVTYYVIARDAAGNQSGQSNSVTRTGTTPPDTTPPTTPGSLAYTQPASGQIKLTWNAATDANGIASYQIFANGALRGTVSGTTLTYTDSQPDTATVSYYVNAKDPAGNTSANSNTVTRTGTGNPPTGTNVALNKPITASSSVFTFIPTNANDGSVTTYWEGAGGAYPNLLTVALGANHDISSIVLKLNPDTAWGQRVQNIQVLGREQSATGYTSLVAGADYTFNPGSGNTVTINVTARVADVQLKINSNTGSSAGQIAEFQVFGVPAPNPDLTITGSSWSPASPIETDAITVSATVKNIGTANSGTTNVNFYLGTTLVGTATVGGLAANGTSTVSANIGAKDAGSYTLTAKVDESNAVVEQLESNNAYTNPTQLVVAQVASSDLISAPTAWTPGTPAAGNTVTFTVAIKNQGTIASAGGAHNITVTVTDTTTGTVVKTLTGAYTGVINAGATAPAVSLGTWVAVNGKYTVKTVIAVDANELAVKQANNTSTQSFFVGRGANLPYEMYEAEDGTWGGGASQVGPNRTIGDLGGEASGRKAVTLNSTGAYVQWTTRAATNTLVVRFSIPDGPDTTLNIYVNGAFHKAIPLTAKHSWLYGNEASPSNSPGAGPRHIYDEANIMLNSTVPAGSVIKLQKDTANGTTYAVDFINLELTAPKANPDPTKYVVPAGTSQSQVQAAFDTARQSATAVGVYLPAGLYETASKFSVYGKPLQVVGAGIWYTRFQTPVAQANTDAGFRIETSANGSTFKDFSFFGNYDIRNDGPGKVFGELKDVANLTFDNIWAEHTVCFYWGVHNDNIKITNTRIRNTFADGVNFTSDSTNLLISNVEGRGNGDDAFALFSAIDGGGSVGNHNNVFENLTATLTWRAAGLAVYGGYDNVFRNMYIADMLTYSGITISSLDFGYPFVGFSCPATRFENISLVRAGGHFWGQQAFGAIWVFAASKDFKCIRVTDVDIIDPTYSGIMFQSKYPEAKPITDTIFTNIRISGAQKSGDAYDAKSGIGIWVNELPEPGQGPAVGSATFNNLVFSNNFQNIRNTTSTFTLTINP